MTVITEMRSSSRRHPVELIGGWEAGLIVFMVQDSQPGPNEYGPNPKAAEEWPPYQY